jgi:hypothetical protein
MKGTIMAAPRGYPDLPSVEAGALLRFHVWSEAPQFRIDLYRYPFSQNPDGTSGWLVSQTANQAQAPGSPSSDWNWPAYDLTAPGATGVYIAFIIEGDGNGNVTSAPPDFSTTFAPDSRMLVVVRSATPGATARILYKLAVFTYHSYNKTGNGGLYDGVSIVTMRRPGGGTGGDTHDALGSDAQDTASPYQTFEHWDAKFISWLSQEGYIVDYCTDFDVHSDGSLLNNYAVLLCVGHDEYWTEDGRAHVEAFRDRGGHIALFCGNTCWWRVRFTGPTEYSSRQPGDWWWDTELMNPENKLTGVSYRNGGAWYTPDPQTPDGRRTPLGFTVNRVHWALPGLPVQHVIGADARLVGYECDGAVYWGTVGTASSTGDDGTPANFEILAIAELGMVGDTGTDPTLGTGWFFDQREAALNQKYGHAATLGLYHSAAGSIVFTAAAVDWPRVLLSGDSDVNAITTAILDVMIGEENFETMPATVATAAGYAGVFVVAVSGRLWELPFQGNWLDWVNHGTPPTGSVDVSAPSAAVAKSGYLGVFLSAEGSLIERYRSGGQWYWTDHGPPPGTAAAGAPSLVAAPSGYVGAFVRSADGRLFERYYVGSGQWAWTDHGMPPGTAATYDPSAVAAASGYIGVFIVGTNGRVFERYFVTGTGWIWTDHGTPPGALGASASSAVAASSGYVGAFIAGDNGNLFELYYTHQVSNWLWTDHGQPPGSRAVSAPSAIAAPSGYVGTFLRGDNGHFYERYFTRQAAPYWFWTDHGGNLAAGPTGLAAPWGYVGSFAAGADGQLWECYFADEGPDWPWTRHPR